MTRTPTTRSSAGPSIMETRADVYVSGRNEAGRAAATATIEGVLDDLSRRRTRTDLGRHADPDLRTTMLETWNGTCVRHDSSSTRPGSWVVRTDIDLGSRGHLRIQIDVEALDPPHGILPDHSSRTAAKEAVLSTIRAARVHLEGSTDASSMNDPEDERMRATECMVGAAHAEPPSGHDFVAVMHASPWCPIRVIDVMDGVDLLDDEARARMPAVPTRLGVTIDMDGEDLSIESIHGTCTAPDAVERLRTLAATTRREP